jgi:hypothetical protein
MSGSLNPTVFAASVANGGPGAAALKYLDEDEEAKDPAPTAEGDYGEADSSEDEKPAPEDDGCGHQAKRQACLARLVALVGTQIQVCMFSLPNPPQGGLYPSNLFNIAHRRLWWWWTPRALTRTRSPSVRRERKTHAGKIKIAFSDKLLSFGT